VLIEGNDLAFDIKAVASPNAGSDLTVVVQTRGLQVPTTGVTETKRS